MPPRRTSGRHRKPKHSSRPAYVTAATLAAFTVSGLNVPGAIGDSREPEPSAATTQALQPTRTVVASQLRATLVRQDSERATRLRAVRTSMVQQVQDAAEAERKAREAARPKWFLPVDHSRLTAGFGDWGLWASSHTGQDFAAPEGTPIRAVGDGKVIFAGYEGAYGNKVVVQHADGTLSWYAHMSSILRSSGTVQAGEVIGRIGSTGNVTGPHLHLEIRPGGGGPVPPLTWLRQHGIRI